jgi:hypothetical protein
MLAALVVERHEARQAAADAEVQNSELGRRRPDQRKGAEIDKAELTEDQGVVNSPMTKAMIWEAVPTATLAATRTRLRCHRSRDPAIHVDDAAAHHAFPLPRESSAHNLVSA